MDIAWIWIPVTILAAAFQVGRNVIQRRLVEELGTIGATQVRFLALHHKRGTKVFIKLVFSTNFF